jgi:hypothetical protein
VIIWAHIPAVIYGALVEFSGFTCPLTLLENDLRQRAGEARYRGGFISHYLVKVIYPPGLTHGMQSRRRGRDPRLGCGSNLHAGGEICGFLSRLVASQTATFPTPFAYFTLSTLPLVTNGIQPEAHSPTRYVSSRG